MSQNCILAQGEHSTKAATLHLSWDVALRSAARVRADMPYISIYNQKP